MPLEFAIAFFGIIWLVFRFVSRKTRTTHYEKYSVSHQEEWSAFRRKYTASSDETALVWRAVRENSYNGQKVTDYLKEDLVYVYGLDYTSKWDSSPFSVIGGMKYWAGNILLATMGKVTQRSTFEGYCFAPENREEVKRVCQRIEVRLQENDVNTRLFFEPLSDKSTNWTPDYEFTNSRRFVFEQNLFWEYDKHRCRVW